MKFEDVKVGMRVTFENDAGEVTHIGLKNNSGYNKGVWVRWDSDSQELWLQAEELELESVTKSKLTQADYQLLKEILKEVLDPLEFRIKHKQGFTHTEVKRLVTKRNKIAQLQWKVKKAIT